MTHTHDQNANGAEAEEPRYREKQKMKKADASCSDIVTDEDGTPWSRAVRSWVGHHPWRPHTQQGLEHDRRAEPRPADSQAVSGSRLQLRLEPELCKQRDLRATQLLRSSGFLVF